jgi:ATP-dependent Clp protease ATP-binding subunit ClpC
VQEAQNERVIAAARERLSPEFYNRLDEVLVFGPLESREVEEIAKRALVKLAQTVHAQRGIWLEFAADVTQLLLRQGGFDAALGARPMRRAVARWIEAPLAEALLSGRFQRSDRVVVSTEGQRVVFARGGAGVHAAE